MSRQVDASALAFSSSGAVAVKAFRYAVVDDFGTLPLSELATFSTGIPSMRVMSQNGL